jgi:Domain of unknown function (DUF6438)
MIALLFAALLLQQPTRPGTAMDPLSITVPAEEAEQHLIGDRPLVRAKAVPRGKFFFATVTVNVLVDKNGAVLWAEAVPKPPNNDPAMLEFTLGEVTPDIVARAEAAVRDLRFVAFRRGGQAVAVMFQQQVEVLPPELKPPLPAPFPQVKDWKSVRVSLLRVGCFGSCPAYGLVVSGDGSVSFNGRAYVVATGQRFGSISREQLAELVSLIRHADFYTLENNYGSCGTDAPDVFLSVEIEGWRKDVWDCLGEWYGMPRSVRKVEEAIDRLSGAEAWIKPNSSFSSTKVAR